MLPTFQKTEVGKTKVTIRHSFKAYRKPSEQLFPNRRPLSYPNFDKDMETYKYKICIWSDPGVNLPIGVYLRSHAPFAYPSKICTTEYIFTHVYFGACEVDYRHGLPQKRKYDQMASPAHCIHHFCIIRWFPAYKKSIWEKQVTRTPLTSKVRGVLVTCFSNIDFSKAGNQRIMQKW